MGGWSVRGWAFAGLMLVGQKKSVWLARTVRSKTERERRDRDNVNVMVGVPWERMTVPRVLLEQR